MVPHIFKLLLVPFASDRDPMRVFKHSKIFEIVDIFLRKRLFVSAGHLCMHLSSWFCDIMFFLQKSTKSIRHIFSRMSISRPNEKEAKYKNK